MASLTKEIIPTKHIQDLDASAEVRETDIFITQTTDFSASITHKTSFLQILNKIKSWLMQTAPFNCLNDISGSIQTQINNLKIRLDTSDETVGHLNNTLQNLSSQVSEVMSKVYPIGSIYFTTVSTNPRQLFGFGTWNLWGSGRVPLGINTGDNDFNTVEKTGGAKTVSVAHSHTVNSHTHSTGNHMLTVNEMPQHRHDVLTEWTVLPGSFPSSQLVSPEEQTYASVSGAKAGTRYPLPETTQYIGNNGAHNHGNTGSSSPGTSSSLGSITNMPPFITCYMWKRIG